MALNVKQKYPGTQGGAAQLYASDTRLSLRRDQQLYIHIALHLLCLPISSRQCRSHRRLDFFYSNKNYLVQLEDTAAQSSAPNERELCITVLIFTRILNQTLCLGLYN